MIKNPNFEIVNIDDDYMAIPLGDESTSFHGIIALSSAMAYLLKKMDKSMSTKEMVGLLVEEFDVDTDTAQKDVEAIIQTLLEMGVILES